MISKSFLIIFLFLISATAGCLEQNTDLSSTDKEPEKIVPVEVKEENELGKTVPVEYYIEEEMLDPGDHGKGLWAKKFWLSKFNITEEEGNEIIAQCREAFDQNAERLARDVTTKIPENWAGGEVQLKKEKFLMGNESASLGKFEDKVIARFHGIGFGANTSAFDDLVLHIGIANDCIYDLKEKKVEKIKITFWPVLWLE